MHASVLRVMASEGERSRRGARSAVKDQAPLPAEDFPYKIELWDDRKQAVEQVVAVASSAAVAHAAFYAAAREFGDRFVTLRHKASIINRWNGPAH